ncbi:hypothetical protein Belba_0637 [Belliella baltica DSM 15883]|uniref:Histidine kinase N-terminal 7TM region domain-containing protein n=1 Tax=Belliella baltica (strain DSM 15883 / CIP 108006 / LMG 21964 / BA134) TaxID=866536 RepID=I3Z224_BELBD|nr:hypothetical protein [Belliella baltica]AFL83292.1 hypothetical protein Belba_0637 [Belliella baltica DSM 15883]
MELIDWYNGSLLVGLLFSIPHFFLKSKYKKEHLISFAILIVANILELYGEYTVQRKINNSLAYNLFFVYGETLLILGLFYSIFKEKKPKFFLKIASFAFLLWGILYTILIENLRAFHTLSFSIGSLIIILCCIYFLVSIFLKEWYIKEFLMANPLFWITVFIFFFYSATTLYFSSVNLILKIDPKLNSILASINKIMAVTMYLGMGLAFYLPYFNRSEQKI